MYFGWLAKKGKYTRTNGYGRACLGACYLFGGTLDVESDNVYIVVMRDCRKQLDGSVYMETIDVVKATQKSALRGTVD